ncbi:MAG: hypothetical protein ACTSWN_06725 [Promethearchaeota archaeon]
MIDLKENKKRSRCIVKNCGKVLDEDQIVKIRGKTFCRSCAVYYFRSKFQFLD